MPDPIVLDRLVSEVARQVRFRRAEFYGLRGLFVGALLALVPLVLREILGPLGLIAAGALLFGGFAVGAAYGLLLKLPATDVARLADRGYQLQDRIATAVEWGARPDRTPVVEALVADTVARVERLDRRFIIPRLLPREAKLVPVPLVAGLLLSVAPPIPLPEGRLPNFSVSKDEEEEKPKERVGDMQTADRATAAKRDPIQRADL